MSVQPRYPQSLEALVASLQREVEALKRAPVEAWRDVAIFTNFWVNYGGAGWSTAAFFKDPFGVVHLKGLISSGTGGAAAFTLPDGYKPPLHETFIAISWTGAYSFGEVNVMSSGAVAPVTGGTTWTSLCGITFRAA